MDGDAEKPTEAVAALFLDESEPALPETNLGPGTRVSGYVIDAQIGKGATGIVYAATHPTIGKRVAIKVLRQDLCDHAESIARFVLEARAVNEIQHPNIVDIFDLGTLPDGRSFLVMDLLVGRSLRQRLAAGPLHVSEAATVIDECASALIAAHDKGFVHRDLKPDNVFLVEIAGRRPDVRLLDFGVVKLLASSHPNGGGVRTRLGAVIGTPHYMSPEQARAKNVDHRTDIYALGVMSFELLAGRRPFEHRNVLDLLIAHAEAPIPSLRERVPSLPIEVTQLVESMLEKRPGDRPTLPAVRAVIKRLVGSVIPTYTDAVAQLAAGDLPPPPEAEEPGIATRNDRPEKLGATRPFARPISEPRPSAGVAQVMPAYLSPSLPSLPKVVARGTPSKTEQVPELEELDEPISRPSRGWIWFSIAAILVAAGGLLLGMSL